MLIEYVDRVSCHTVIQCYVPRSRNGRRSLPLPLPLPLLRPARLVLAVVSLVLAVMILIVVAAVVLVVVKVAVVVTVIDLWWMPAVGVVFA